MSNNPTNPTDLSAHFQGLRVSAQPFVPNVNATPFQPGGGGGYQAQMYGGGIHYAAMAGHPSMYSPAGHMMYPPAPPSHQQGYVSGYHPGMVNSGGPSHVMMRPSPQAPNDLQYRYTEGNGKFQSSQQQQHQQPSVQLQSNLPQSSGAVESGAVKTMAHEEVDSWEQRADESTTEALSNSVVPELAPTTREPVGTKGAVTSEETEPSSTDRHPTTTISSSDNTQPSPNVERTNKSKEESTSSKIASVKTVTAPPKDACEKENVNIVFIGHVDAGKSTIGGHIMYLTGGVDKRTLEKYEREAKEKNRETWYLSWALDTNQEERDKGKTVEVGRAYFETDRKRFTILDAPGHAGFVPNMIGGTVQADIGILVISARRGEFETGFEKGGQTREHAMLAKTAGVKHLVVLVNKMDDPTVEWSENRYEECKTKLTPFLKKLGFNPKTDLFFMPVSGLTGANLKEPVTDKWYKGPAFIPYLDNLPSIIREDEGPFRMPIAEKFKDMGIVVMGKVESGSVCKGSQFVLMPNRTLLEVLTVIRVEDEVPAAYSGDNIKLKVKGLEDEDISPGFVLCSPHSPCHVGRVFDAQVVILEYKSIICAGFSCVLHIHSAVEEVEIIQLIAKIDKKTGKKIPEKPKFIKQDSTAIARFQTSRIVCMETFKDFAAMARFTLRDEGKTIAIGKVLKIIE